LLLAGAIGSSGPADRWELAGIGVLVIAIAGGSWLVSLRLWPYTFCRRCRGGGRNSGSNSRRHGRCKKCKGKPERLRPGARLVRSRRWDK